MASRDHCLHCTAYTLGCADCTMRRYYLKTKIIHNQKGKARRDANIEAERKRGQVYYEKNKNAVNERRKASRQADPMLRMIRSYRTRMHEVLGSGNGYDKMLAADAISFRKWLCFYFEELGPNCNMTIDNHGTWHLDHVIPCKEFDLTKEELRYVCFHWSNLRPLDKHENLVKNSKIDIEAIKNHNKILKKFCIENNVDIVQLEYPIKISKTPQLREPPKASATSAPLETKEQHTQGNDLEASPSRLDVNSDINSTETYGKNAEDNRCSSSEHDLDLYLELVIRDFGRKLELEKKNKKLEKTNSNSSSDSENNIETSINGQSAA